MPETAINGVRLHYETLGDGPPLLFLHGGGMSSRSFRQQRFVLAKERQVVAVDTRAHGRSTDGGAAGLSYAQMSRDIVALLDTLGIARASILGWSDGGVVALDLAMNAPDRVESIAVFGTNYRVAGLTTSSIQWMKNVTAETWPKDMADDYRRESPHPERWPILVDSLKAMWLREPSYTATELKKISCPALIASGDRDMVRLEHTVELFNAIVRAELAVFPGSTHFVLWEQPERTNDILASFFRRALSPTTNFPAH